LIGRDVVVALGGSWVESLGLWYSKREGPNKAEEEKARKMSTNNGESVEGF
jgi:hypothetical protein